MSRNTKQILIVLAAAIVFCVIGAAAALGGAGLIVDRFKNNVSEDPEKVRQMAKEFMSYELPSGYTEQMGMDFILYKMILISSEDTDNISSIKPLIFVAHFQSQNMDPDQMIAQMKQSVEQQSKNDLKLKVVETRNVTINGSEAPLTVSEGTNSAGVTFRQWITAFPGKTGLIIILIQGPTENWDDAAFNDFLTSIGF